MIFRLAIACCLLLLPPAARGAGWTRDFDQACTNAKAAGQCILLHFTEADWYGGRMPLDNEVFSKREFTAFASTSLVCVLVDFPRNKPQSRKRRESNLRLAKRFGVSSLPCVVLLSPDAAEIGRTERRDWDAAGFVAYLEELIGRHRAAQESAPAGAGP